MECERARRPQARQARARTARNQGNARLKASPARGAMWAAAVPMAMDCGQIILPMPAPITFAAASRFAGTPSALAAPVWRDPKRTLALVPEPVTKPPSAPTSGAKKG